MSSTWTDAHTQTVVRGIISAALASRSTLYTHPDLADVNSNGGDRINKKLQQVLVALEKVHGMDGATRAEVARLKGAKGGGGGTGGGGAKSGKRGGGGGGKGDGKGKEKVKAEAEAEKVATRGKKRKIVKSEAEVNDDAENEDADGQESTSS